MNGQRKLSLEHAVQNELNARAKIWKSGSLLQNVRMDAPPNNDVEVESSSVLSLNATKNRLDVSKHTSVAS